MASAHRRPGSPRRDRADLRRDCLRGGRATMTDRKADYEIGHGRPPSEFQFKKGQSGNLSGRPKALESYADTTCRVINQTIPVTEKGKRRHISKFEAYVTQ